MDLLERGLPGFTHDRLAVGDLGRSTRPRAVIAGSRELRQRARHYDIVHAHGDLTSMLAAAVLGAPCLVVTTHGLNYLRRARGTQALVARAGYRRVLARARAVICNSWSERDELWDVAGRRGSRDRRLVVIPNGVAISQPATSGERRIARTRLGLKDDDFAVVVVGDLTANKDPYTAVRATLRLRGAGLRTVLLLAGDGPLRKDLAGVEPGAVRLLGFKRDIKEVLSAADAFVSPSLREGLPYAVLEAMAAGLPAIVSECPGNTDAVGEAGLQFPVGDDVALADRLRMLQHDSERCRALGTAARARVRERFSLAAFADLTQSVYESALSHDRS